MKAIRIHQHGGTEVLTVDTVDKPEPGRGEALVNIKATSLNHLDIWVRQGIPGVPLPLVMGSDGAGVIESLGPGTGDSGWKTGDEVFCVPFRSCGFCRNCISGNEQLCRNYRIVGEHLNGMQAEYAVIPVEYLLPKPGIISWEETAAFPLATQTAYHMLVKKAGIKMFDTVLIWGASSGIGSAAIQIAKLYSAIVITTAANEKKAEFAEKLGADHIVNYKKEDVAKRVKEITGGSGVDIVFEHTGAKTWQHSQRSLKRGGKIVLCGATTGPKIEIDLRHVFMKHQQIIGSTMGNRSDLIEISKMIEAGKFKPAVSKVFEAEQIKEAHEYLASGRQTGKVVIRF